MNTQINYQVFNSFPILESERLILRNFVAKDAENLYAIRSDRKVMQYMDTPLMESKTMALDMIERNQVSFVEKKGINWAIEDKETKQMIGYFGFWRLMPAACRVEVGYALHTDYWCKGYMSEVFAVALNFAFKKLKTHGIEANVNPANKASILLLEKMGFRKEAHFRENYLFEGRFIDSAIYCLLESDIS